MEHIISSVAPGSIAQEMGIEPGDRLLEVNGKSPEDVFDYRYLMNEEEILVLIRKANAEAAVTNVFSVLSISFPRECVRLCILRMMIPDFRSYREII